MKRGIEHYVSWVCLVVGVVMACALMATMGRSAGYWFVSGYFALAAILTALSKGRVQIGMVILAVVGVLALLVGSLVHSVSFTMMLLGTLGILIVTETFAICRGKPNGA